MGWRGDNRGLLVTRTHLAVLRHAAIKLNGGNALAARQSTSVGARRGRATVNHILPTSTASKHTTFGPDAFTPEFVKAVRAAASDAPPVTYDGEAFICGEVTLRSQLPASKAIAATAHNVGREIHSHLTENEGSEAFRQYLFARVQTVSLKESLT